MSYANITFLPTYHCDYHYDLLWWFILKISDTASIPCHTYFALLFYYILHTQLSHTLNYHCIVAHNSLIIRKSVSYDCQINPSIVIISPWFQQLLHHWFSIVPIRLLTVAYHHGYHCNITQLSFNTTPLLNWYNFFDIISINLVSLTALIIYYLINSNRKFFNKKS